MNYLQCGGCGHKEYVQEESFPACQELGDKFAKLSKGELSKEEFLKYLQTVELPELKELQIAATLWACTCGESNPPNFPACWKCGENSGLVPTESKGEEVDLGERQPGEQGMIGL